MNSTKAYEILNIKENSSIEEIKSAFRKLSRQHHPDRNLNFDSKNVFLKIKHAYNFLLNLKDQDSSENKALSQPSPNEFKLELTLEEIFTGCTKNKKITCKVTDKNGIQKLEEKVLNVVIKPGVLTGTRITIDQEGNRHHGEIPANVVFTVHDKPHETFKRDRFDLKYTATISVEEAILGCELTIPTLDNDTVPLTIDGPITHKSVKRIPDRGFLYPDSNKRGDLIIFFNIITQIKTIEKELYLTHAQAKNGCSKNVLINRKIINLDGTENFEDKIVSVDIKPETQFGTKITFLEEGDQNESGKRSDVVFVVCQQPTEEHKEQQNKSSNDSSIYYRELNIPIGSSIQVINEAYQALKLNTSTRSKSSLIKKSMKIAEAYSQLMKIKFEEENDQLTDSSVSSEDEEILVKKQEKLAPNKFNLKLSLEEIYNGCTKHQKITTKIVNQNGAEKKQEKPIKVDVKPGSLGGTEIILPFEGDACYGKINADVIFTVIEEPHDIYRRNGYDIEYTAQITPKEAILGGKIIIQTLENKPFENNFNGGITPGTVQRIHGRGMPILDENNKFGDLIIKFDLIFDDDPVNNTQGISNEKLSPKNFNLKLTLEEIYRGCVKYQTVSITDTLKNGNKEKKENPILVNVKPGSINGTKITVPNVGDTCFGKWPADVIFTVREEPHSLFQGKGYDIEYIPKVKITQKEAILGGKLSIPTLENKPFDWTFKGGIRPESVQRIPKRGLPVLNEKNQFGDMLVKCEVMMDQEIPQDPAIRHEISISLEQILSGCTKKVKINRVLIDSHGNEKDEAKVLTIEIKPGTTDGTKFIFPREGDQHPGRISADIVFVVRDKPHETFTRNGVDIEHTMTITKSQLSNGGQLQVPTLANDGPKYVSLDELQEKNAFRRIQNYGLPFLDKPNKRGDLLIMFKIEKDPQDEPIIRNLDLSYEQILFGWAKKLKIKSRIFDNNGNEISIRENIIDVVVEKGTFEGTEIIFEKLGDRYPGTIPADIIFIVRYKNHPIFDRKGFDIYYTAIITTSEARNGVEFEIPTLEATPLLLTIIKGITIKDIQRIENRGLPYPDDPYKRGDLIVRYNIVENAYKDFPIEHLLPLSLEEIFYGGEKQLKIKRELLNPQGEIINEVKVVTINIHPGINSGKKFTFPRLGDNLHHDRIPADIVFIVREKEHSTFKRNGNDLEYTATITDDQAMLGCTLKIPTIENEERELTIDKGVTKSASRKFKGIGLPDPKQTENRGDLIIRFNIIKDPINSDKSNKQDSKFDEKFLNENSKIQEPASLDNTEDESTSSFKQTNSIPQDDAVEHYVPVTLENILHGCTKKLKIKRKIFNEMTDKFEEKDKIVEIIIKPGTVNETKILLSKVGDKYPNKIPADVEVILVEENHPTFTRYVADLFYTAKLTEQQFSNGVKLWIPTLDGEPISIYISKAYDNINEVKRIPAHGLPLFNNNMVRGDLVVSFQIVENVEFSNENLAQAGKSRRYHTYNQNIQYVDFPLRLENILTGFSEKFTMENKVVTTVGTKYVLRKLFINVDPGTPNGTHIHPLDENGKICKDIELITIEIPHKYFKRCGVDIEYTMKISINKALTGGRFEVPLLEGDKMYFKLSPVITSKTTKVILKKGLPYKDNPKLRGNLIIKFEINDDNETFIQKIKRIHLN